MIQEKDFLYRVPVKTAPITTPRGQIRNPEILVDLEGGEFMHGNILDANSTNKLINQSVKDAVDNKLIESGCVTKDLLDAETSARTKGDEDLGVKIKAEQTRAEGKEKEISDKLAIVDGDSNTEGSFRKAIADVIAAAPEDLDTLKEIADKLAGNDDLHTALNQAITEKADATALANEVTRATGAERGLQAAIATKADATTLSNYVLTTALNQQVDTLNAAISAKQDAGNYIPYDVTDTTIYKIDKPLKYKTNNGEFGFFDNGKCFYIGRSDSQFEIISNSFELYTDGRQAQFTVYDFSVLDNKSKEKIFSIGQDGIEFKDRKNTEVPVADGSGFADLNDYAKKTELPTVPTKTSELTNDSNFISDTTAFASAEQLQSVKVGLSAKQNKITVNEVDVTDIETADITKLRTIVTNLINALSASKLIIQTEQIE